MLSDDNKYIRKVVESNNAKNNFHIEKKKKNVIIKKTSPIKFSESVEVQIRDNAKVIKTINGKVAI